MIEAIKYFALAYPRRSFLTLLCLVAAAGVEGFGLAALVPLLALAIRNDAGTSISPNSLEAGVRDILLSLGIPFTLVGVAGVVIAIIWLKAIVMLFANRQVGNTVAHVATDLRLQVLRSMLAARWSYYTRQPVGRITNAVATEANRAAESYHGLALAAQHGVLTLLAVGFAFLLSWQLTLAAVAGGAAIGLLLHILVGLAGKVGQRQTQLVNSLLSRLSDALINVRVLRATGRERLIGPLLAKDTKHLGKVIRDQVLLEEVLKALQEPLVMMLLIGVVVFAHGSMGMSFERVTVLIFALTRALVTATKVQRRHQLAASHISALVSIRELIGGADAAAEVSTGTAQPTFEDRIALRDIHFAYGEKQVLTGLELDIPAGEITALVGASGGGKSTLVDLLTGLAEPDSGEVTIDGISLREIDLRIWRSRIGYVPQEVILFHDSVRMNLTLGDSSLSDDQLEQALRNAGVWEVISALPDGLDASVGERGSLLSGGQRARVALARALAPNPSLLILDEATSALDPKTELEIWDTMFELRGRVTILAVSHQPALTKVADRIYRIEGGVASRVEDLLAAASP